jgi:transposase
MFGSILNAVTSPITDTLDVLEGLTEGEIRTKAIARLGADAVAGMATAELIDLLLEEEED